MNDWMKVKHAADCEACEMCGEPYCRECDRHYNECDCPGPCQDDMFEYEIFDGELFARPKD
jgi:hypothetical protein